MLDVFTAAAAGAAAGDSVPTQLSSQQISELSQVGLRRTQVILYLLRDAGLVRRSRVGYVLIGAAPDDATLGALLTEYNERAAHDKCRLSEMMEYAQTTTCRTQVLRAYFGEEIGEICNRCDNCDRGLRQGHAARSADAASADRAAAPAAQQLARLDTAVGRAAERDAHGATVVETIHGEIHTTAPETLPQPEKSPFGAGDRVRHKSFGVGRILDIHAKAARVRFERSEHGGARRSSEKRVCIDFLQAAC